MDRHNALRRLSSAVGTALSVKQGFCGKRTEPKRQLGPSSIYAELEESLAVGRIPQHKTVRVARDRVWRPTKSRARSHCPYRPPAQSRKLAHIVIQDGSELYESWRGLSLSPADWRRFSAKVENLANGLLAVANLREIYSAHYYIWKIFSMARDLNRADECFSIFAAFGPASDLVRIDGSFYPSAHRAVFEEAMLLIKKNFYSKFKTHFTIFDFSRTAWSLEKSVILHHLSNDWQEDFKALPARLLRERAAVEMAVSHQELFGNAVNVFRADARHKGLNALPLNAPGFAGPLGKTPMQPEAGTMEAIALLQRGKSHDEVAEATGKTIYAVRKICSRLKQGQYTVKRDRA